jgi:predicted nucleotidyltransferase
VTEALLSEMTRRLRDAGDPLKIMLFGSHARGEAGPYSDLDLLVIEDADRSRREASVAYRLALLGSYPARDVVVRTPQEIETRRGRLGRLERQVMKEGRVLYERETAAS